MFVALQEKNIKHTGNITMDDIISIARVMRPRSCARDLSGVCKEILGTAQSVGCTVDRKHPRDLCGMVGGWSPGFKRWVQMLFGVTCLSTTCRPLITGLFHVYYKIGSCPSSD